MKTFSVCVVENLGPDLGERVLELVGAASDCDGVAPLNEHALLRLGDPSGASRHVVGMDDADLVGYGFLDLSGNGDTGAECVVRPCARDQGLGRALVARLLTESGDRPLAIWSHGDFPAAAAVAGHTGLRRVRELRRMRRDLADELPPVVLPDGVSLRTFSPGTDDQTWVNLNARAFATHPEQGAMTIQDLRERQRQPWFDAAGFFVAERAGEMVGFHWTKVHMELVPAVGEVYMVGVSPHAQGGGLGRALSLRGLHFLRDAGLGSVQLYVEADNAPALRVYARLGFAVDSVDAQYRS